MLLLTGLCGTVQASTIFVTSLEQKISETGGCSLQEAIYSANFDNNIAIDSLNLDGTDHFITTECVAGNGDDTIVLPTRAVLQMGTITDESYNYMGPTATPIIFTNITIEAHGARLEHLANGVNFRAFAVGTASISTPGGTVSGTGNLTIRNVHIKGFTVKGGDGGDGYFGGGGGMGAGGAIYVDGGVLTVDASTFEGNGAAGGAGGAYTNPVVGGEPGGGGGGLSGNGGDAHAGVFTGSGGGGARGNGAESISGTDQNGGHGGGTFSDGIGLGGFVDGFRCGGNGGDKTGYDNDGQGGTCAGGGGGGGATADSSLPFNDPGTGGNGNYGGGGGGGGSAFAGGGSNGGKGGFGGGGGGCGGIDDIYPYNDGGNGGFGGGGGACSQNIGKGGAFGGESSLNGGGGGAGLGGAIFNSGGTVTIRNSTFTGNFVTRGAGSDGAENGADAGAAIFSLWGSLSMFNSTVDGNESTGPLGGVFFDNRGLGDCGFFEACLGPSPSFFTLRNTIIAHNGVGFNAPRECSIFDPASSDFYKPVLTVAGSGNLITQNETGNITGYLACPGVVATGDPQLGPLQNNQGPTPTMAIPITWPAPNTNPAFNAADAATSLATDQRGQERPQEGGYDIGAFELCVDNSTGLPCLILSGILDTRQLTIQTSSAAGGTVSPAPGTYSEPLNSVVVVAATPNPNYCFVNWTGPVTIPTSPSTTVVINDEQTVTANFAAFNNTVAKPLLNPSTNHGLVNVGLAASNNCGDPATLQVQVFGDEDDQTPTDKKGTVFSPDATNIAVSTLRLRAERTDSGDGRVYLIVVRNNTGFGCNTVVVPHDSSALSLASVNSQAAAALAYCQANNGTAPAAYFVIGDGPVIGSKQ